MGFISDGATRAQGLALDGPQVLDAVRIYGKIDNLTATDNAKSQRVSSVWTTDCVFCEKDAPCECALLTGQGPYTHGPDAWADAWDPHTQCWVEYQIPNAVPLTAEQERRQTR